MFAFLLLTRLVYIAKHLEESMMVQIAVCSLSLDHSNKISPPFPPPRR